MAALTATLNKEPDITAIAQRAQKRKNATLNIEEAKVPEVVEGILWPPR